MALGQSEVRLDARWDVQIERDRQDLNKLDGDRFGKLERPELGKRLHRYRAKDYRIYVEVVGKLACSG
jgi:hypothetical protein